MATVVGIVAAKTMGAGRTMGTEDLQGIRLIEVVEIILLGGHLMGEGQEGNDPGHTLRMKGTMLVVVDRMESGTLLKGGKTTCKDLYEFGWTRFRYNVPINDSVLVP